MARHAPRLLFVLIIAVLASSLLAMPIAAAPWPGDTGSLLNTKQSKAEAKAEAEAKKEQAKAEAAARKQQKTCKRDGTLPCNPTVTVDLVPVGGGICIAVVGVRGFAPGLYLITGSFSPEHERGIEVGNDGTGSEQLAPPFESGQAVTVTVHGISVTSTPDCHV